MRDRKKERTRQQLESIALAMFDERGFDAVTVDEIAAEADVSHRTFYRYFPCKEDVLLGDPHDKIVAFVGALRARPADESPFAALRGALLDFADDYQLDQATHAARSKVIQATPSLALRVAEKQMAWELALTPVLAERLGHGSDGATSDAARMLPRLLTACAVGAIRAAIELRASGSERSLRDLVDEAFDLLARGLDVETP